MKQFNEKLARWINSVPSSEAGINNIQIPGQVEHLVWQNRYKEPSLYEQNFVQQLIQAFTNDVTELNDLVAALNQQDFRNESGDLWTVENFTAEMQRLGY
ncbi:hypothetical protein B9T31_11655 [Acinetobacter sp. ANC 4558]|uniref:recombinase-like helix-turn-helix domain-containing protein n=1 Tax=Acinetobacter sp. ANC 4558 TaxID=1977876 RepID=UPI000A34CA64|nr:recombinase-like helix-turn-helix domain-containing protein [Acinetobacter sp. ANC 4558]OTG85447.1 hypothetical protein B9T31_11655 [Acinetobacter sp. ANC 4558]